MDVLDDMLIIFWKALNKNEVKYIIVGDYATCFHGFNHITDVLDLWIMDTIENRKKLRETFKEVGQGDLISLETLQFVPGRSSFYVGPGIEVDIMTSMKGLEQFTFEECLGKASLADLEGVTVPFLHINHLIENKKVVNRPKDQVDVKELERIKKIREQNS